MEKANTKNFGWRKHSLFWVLSNPNISPLPEACFLYITQQVLPLPDYSFKGHLKPLLFIHYLNVFSSQQPLLPGWSILPGAWHRVLKCSLGLAPSSKMYSGSAKPAPWDFPELIVLSGAGNPEQSLEAPLWGHSRVTHGSLTWVVLFAQNLFARGTSQQPAPAPLGWGWLQPPGQGDEVCFG